VGPALLSRLRETFSRVEDFPPEDAVHLDIGAAPADLPWLDKRRVVVADCSIEPAWRFTPITTIGLTMLEPIVLYIPDAIRLPAQEGSVFGCRHF